MNDLTVVLKNPSIEKCFSITEDEADLIDDLWMNGKNAVFKMAFESSKTVILIDRINIAFIEINRTYRDDSNPD